LIEYHFYSQAQRPDDYRMFYNTRPLLELNLDFAKWLSHAPECSDTFKDAERLYIVIHFN
jgi:hypothetical protein